MEVSAERANRTSAAEPNNRRSTPLLNRLSNASAGTQELPFVKIGRPLIRRKNVLPYSIPSLSGSRTSSAVRKPTRRVSVSMLSLQGAPRPSSLWS